MRRSRSPDPGGVLTTAIDVDALARSLAFARDGVIVVDGGRFWCVVVDPRRHPLAVCRYGSRATPPIGSPPAVWTNGPLMGKRLLLGRKATRLQLAVEVAGGAAVGVAAARLASRRPMVVVGGACAGAVAAGSEALSGWEPCGAVRSRRLGVRRLETFDGEGPRHAWMSRSGDGFDGLRIGQGDLPECLEGMGGLVRIVRDGAVPATDPGAEGYDAELARLGGRRGVAAWALVPLAGAATADLGGVVAVVGSGDASPLDAGAFLVRLGARDAVATDMSASAFAGTRAAYLLGPAPWPRRRMQPFGLCCL